MELCENGVKAVSWETTNKKASPEFFSRHPVSTLWHYSDYELENIGRLTHPMKYDAASDTWQAVDWDIAFQEIGERLRSYDSAQQVEFTPPAERQMRQRSCISCLPANMAAATS
jgi:anaerobic selenocysteine-containing dehydrogenase